MRRIAVVTGSRADYGIYRPVMRAMRSCPDLSAELWVTGMHLSPELGHTISEIEQDGYPIAERIPSLLSGDSAQCVSQSIGMGTLGFAQALARRRPDIMMVLGDRFEMLAAAVAAHPFCIPVAHIHGGEVTLGALDDAMRHCITKLSHLHFVATDEYARRVVQLGEEPWRVTVTGAPSLDALQYTSFMSKAELESAFGILLDVPVLLVTYHPATLEPSSAAHQADEVAQALKACGLPLVVTAPNADQGGREIATRLKQLVAEHPLAWWVDSMGSRGYFSMMKHAAAMVGNSSSGLLEAPSLKLPVVNIGTRQEGRVRAANVIDVPLRQADIVEAIRKAVSPSFRRRMKDLHNPNGDGHAGPVIAEKLRTVSLENIVIKRFHDVPVTVSEIIEVGDEE